VVGARTGAIDCATEAPEQAYFATSLGAMPSAPAECWEKGRRKVKEEDCAGVRRGCRHTLRLLAARLTYKEAWHVL
jgi:hypothetical protein